ncbi:MAG: response regulator transcription factor [Chloroflexi bacterium]|nr:response regulator transcription factor [Chloroflexota bacterium]
MNNPNDTPAAPDHPLSPRELEVLALLARGLTNKQIARRLSISYPTVRSHTCSIYSKLACRSRAEAAVKALRLRLID